MDKGLAERFLDCKEPIKDALRGAREPLTYKRLLEVTLRTMFSDPDYGEPDYEKVTEVCYCGYEGHIVMVVGSGPSSQDSYGHWVTVVNYGSCSGCDALEAAYGPEPGQTDDLWTICLHMIQGMKRID